MHPNSFPEHPRGSSGAIAELQGLYGPFPFPERLLQRIWREGAFARRGARTVDGSEVEVLEPGSWRPADGPDFKNARIRIDGREFSGDVEVHFRAADWVGHGHGRDPGFDRVILHVVLFPPSPAEERRVRTFSGRRLPTLVLLDRLDRSLEEFAADATLEDLTGRGGLGAAEELAILPRAERREKLVAAAFRRWRQKTDFARRRIGRLGWEGACHATALEIMGCRSNRSPMLRIAERWGLSDFATDPRLPDVLAADPSLGWRCAGARPNNRPHLRLRQYAAWSAAAADWPARWKAWPPPRRPGDTWDPSVVRKAAGLGGWRKRIRCDLVNGCLGDPRLSTLVVDGLLPLRGAIPEDEREDALWRSVWFAWWLGDAPAETRRHLALLGIGGRRDDPVANGWFQGLFGHVAERGGL